MATYRVYFNAHEEFPLVCSIDTGDDTTELNVKTITIDSACGGRGRITSHYRPARQSKFWLEVIGDLEIKDDHAVITQE
jgi:hypothetical protein